MSDDARQERRADAKDLLDQHRYLVDDERDFAAKLVTERRIKLSFVSLVVGLGLFNLGNIPELVDAAAGGAIPSPAFVVVSLLTAATLVLALALIAVESDDPLTRAALAALGLSARAVTVATFPLRRPLRPAVTRPRYTAALRALLVDEGELDQFRGEFPELVFRIENLRVAYERLAISNRRVRKRLERGSFFLIASFISIIVLFGMIVANLGLSPPTDGADTGPESSHVRGSRDVEPAG
ncbi:MAG: hypothetical protein AAFR38_08335 [Planctomycetota bacterium]